VPPEQTLRAIEVELPPGRTLLHDEVQLWRIVPVEKRAQMCSPWCVCPAHGKQSKEEKVIILNK
jgi:hypothetical protein